MKRIMVFAAALILVFIALEVSAELEHTSTDGKCNGYFVTEMEKEPVFFYLMG